MEYQNYSGQTVADALTQASVMLGVTSDRIEYEVVEKGSTGFLGIGAKDAVIKARIKSDEPEVTETAPEAVVENVEPAVETAPAETEVAEVAEVTEAPAEAKKESSHRHHKKATAEDIESAKEIATAFLKQVFIDMELEVEISYQYDEEFDTLNVDLEGPEMGIIIGKRGQTLDSLQYLTNLAVNRKMDSYVRIKMDTEDYRSRREDTLVNLAKNVAYKVKKTRRPVALEAMNPYERRIIHAALSEDNQIATHSEGEEPYRHIVVTLK